MNAFLPTRLVSLLLLVTELPLKFATKLVVLNPLQLTFVITLPNNVLKPLLVTELPLKFATKLVAKLLQRPMFAISRPESVKKDKEVNHSMLATKLALTPFLLLLSLMELGEVFKLTRVT
jgi:hypothetical protein